MTPLIALKDTLVKPSRWSIPRMNLSTGCGVCVEVAGAGVGSGSGVGTATDLDFGARLPDCASAVEKQFKAKTIARPTARLRKSFDLFDMPEDFRCAIIGFGLAAGERLIVSLAAESRTIFGKLGGAGEQVNSASTTHY